MKRFFLVVILAIMSFSTNAQVGAIAGGMAANEVITNLKESINDIIASLDGVMTKQAFDTKQYMQLLLSQLDYVASNNINLTFDRLDETEQKLLNDINFTLANTEALAQKVADNANDVVDNSVALVGTVPFSKKDPTIRRISPAYTLVSNANNFEVIIKGQWLAEKPPFFIVNGQKIIPTTFQDNLIKHRFTNFVVTDPTKVTNQQVELISYKKGFLKKKEKRYKFDVAFIPDQMATYNLGVVTKVSKKVEEQRGDRAERRNGHCEGARDLFLTINARTGWKIDVTSIVDNADCRENSTYIGKRNVTENGFQCHGIVRNSGRCTFGTGDARGKVIINASWKEYRFVDEINTNTSFASGNLIWTEDKTIQLPSNTESFTLTVKKADGTTSIISSNQVDKWFNVTYNNSSKQLIIKPKSAVTEL